MSNPANLTIEEIPIEQTSPLEPPVSKVFELKDGLTILSPKKHLLEQHGSSSRVELSIETIKHLFGEALLTAIEQSLEPKESVFIRGSTVAGYFFGGQPYNPKTGEIPLANRSDVDIITSSIKVKEKILAYSKSKEAHANMSSKANIGGVDIDIVTIDTLREANVTYLQELRKINSNSINHSNSLGEQIDRAIERATSVNNPFALFSIDSYIPVESLCLHLTKDPSGSLRAYLVDPDKLITGNEYLQTDSDYREKMHFPIGTSFPKPNKNSAHSLALKVLERNPMAILKSPLSKQLYGIIPRIVAKASELEIEVNAWGINKNDASNTRKEISELPHFIKEKYPSNFVNDMLESSEQFVRLYDLAIKIMENPESKEMYVTSGSGKQEQLDIWFKRKIQESLVRSLIGNLDKGYLYTFYYFPLAGCISHELGEYFSGYHNHAPRPNILLGEMLNAIQMNEYVLQQNISLEDQFDHFFKFEDYWKYDTKTYKYLRSAVKFRYLQGRYFSHKMIPIREKDSSEIVGYYPVNETVPKNMSEVMAMILVSIGWTPENNSKEIENLVNGWGLKGTIEGAWTIEKTYFDTSLDLNEIVNKMSQVYEEIKNDREWQYINS